MASKGTNMLWLCGLALLVTPGTKTGPFAKPQNKQGVPATTASTEKNVVSYFPREAANRFTDFYSSYLGFIGEPSLLAAAQDVNALSYRLICMGCQRPNFLVVRFSLKPDASPVIATITSNVDVSGRPTLPDKTQKTVTASEAKQFLQMVQAADFWSMPSNEQRNPQTYRMDATASQWVFEGVHGGSYHVVFREGPRASPFTEMARFLAKDLAKLDDSAVPRPFPASKPLSIKTAKNP